MTRKSTINLNKANTAKVNIIHGFLKEYTICVNKFIDELWKIKKFKGSFVEREILNKIEAKLSFSAKQSAAQTALHIVKSQRKKKKKIKPVFSGKAFDLDQRFITILFSDKTVFDIWVKIRGLGLGKGIYLPSKKHKHFLKFKNDNWNLKQCGKLRIVDNKLFLDVFFIKDALTVKQDGETLGLDCGYKKLAVLSNGHAIGKNLEQKILKISRKKQGSKSFKRALAERNDYINKEIKSIPFNTIKTLIVENLKNVKHKSKGRIRKEFMNKLQRWIYSYFLSRLSQSCEVVGVQCHKVDPAYTSQKCSVCNYIHKESRKGEIFLCVNCGHTEDADFNASKNILNRFTLQESSDSVKERYAFALSSA